MFYNSPPLCYNKSNVLETKHKKGGIMSTKKLIRYLEETNAMFDQEDLEITHQLIQDEVRTLKLRSDKHIRISDEKDRASYARLIGICSNGCMFLKDAKDGLIEISIDPYHPKYKTSLVKDTIENVIIVLSIAKKDQKPQKVKR